ncbi:MAG: hypothetical protein K8F91_08205, partial [Candidatus Obscuribacterales bacterium]|nr:hypothetical protein [Candidatus Obscuribacterales bacterium]
IQQNSSTSDGYFTFNEAQSVLDELTKIESRFDSAISVTTTTSLNQDSNWNRGVGHDRYRNHDKWRNNNNINQTQNDILYRLTQAKRDRRLSYKDYANLKSQYDRIVGREAEARNGRGRVSSEERRDLMNRLNNLDDSITRHINNRRVSGRTYRNSR